MEDSNGCSSSDDDVEDVPFRVEPRHGKGPALESSSVTPGLQKDINRAIIYVPGSSHTYIQQNEQYITTYIT